MFSRNYRFFVIISLLFVSPLNSLDVQASGSIPRIDASVPHLDISQEWASPQNVEELMRKANGGDKDVQMNLLNLAYRDIINFRGLDEMPFWLLDLVKSNNFSAKVVKFQVDMIKGRPRDINGSEILAELTIRAESGDRDALYWMGILHLYDWPGHPHNDNEVDKYLLSAAERGHAAAHFDLGMSLYKAKPKEERLPHLIRAAELGLTDAQENLAMILKLGSEVDKNEDEAVKWYMRAGTAEANQCLGRMYQMGWSDHPANLDQAIYYYDLAAKQGEKMVRKYNLKNYLSPASWYSTTEDESYVKEIDAFEGRLNSAINPFLQRMITMASRHLNSLVTESTLEDQCQSIADFSQQIRVMGTKISDHLSTPGFMVSCIVPGEHLHSYYEDHPNAEKVGFCMLDFNGTCYSCLGGNNVKLGFALEQLLGVKKDAALATLNTIRETLEATKNHQQGNPEEVRALEQELLFVNQAPAIIDQSLEMLKAWVGTNVGGRNNAFKAENPWLFEDQ